jgi:hypothetical protein
MHFTDCCKTHPRPRGVESHVGLAASASNGINTSQVCRSISSSRAAPLLQSLQWNSDSTATFPSPGSTSLIAFYSSSTQVPGPQASVDAKSPGLIIPYRNFGYGHIVANTQFGRLHVDVFAVLVSNQPLEAVQHEEHGMQMFQLLDVVLDRVSP